MQSLPVKQKWFGSMQCFLWHKEISFFFHAGFVWMIKLVKKKCFVLSTRFPLSKTALFLPKLHSVLKKKRIEGKSCFCVLSSRAIWPSLIINPRRQFCQEKIVDNTYKEKSHLDQAERLPHFFVKNNPSPQSALFCAKVGI